MGNKTIKESMVTIKEDKLTIVLKELLHLKYILNYYRTSSPKDKPYKLKGKTNKVDMSIANESLKSVENSLRKLRTYIEKLREHSSDSVDNIYFLILDSQIGYDLNNILYVIELIYKKVYQIFEESYHQYIPKPTLGRRFSNNNLVGNLKGHYESIIKSLVADDYKGLILSWSYRNYISLEEKHDRFTNNNGDKYGAYINLPYWYYEIPTLLPSVTHECIRISLLQDNFKYKELKKRLENAVNSYLNNPRDDLSFTQEEKILSDKYNLTNKIVADLLSYKIYGNAYIFSLFHDIIGAGLAKAFDLKDKHNLKMYKSLKDYIENNFDWKASSYKFNNLRDISIIRLKVLLSYVDSAEGSIEDKEHIEQMNELLLSVLSSEGKRSNLESIYENHPHYKDSFLVLKRALLNISKLYIDEVSKLESISLKELENIKNIDFQKLWTQHFNGSIHKNDLRKLLHKETLENIERNIKKENKRAEIGTPYSLTFVKMHKKLNCNNSSELKCLDSVINRCFEDKPPYYHAFGIYDLAILKKTSEYPRNFKESTDKKFKKIDELNSGKKERYYESRYSLMQIYPTIEGKSCEKDNDVSVMYNIDLTTINNSAGRFLACTILRIARRLESNLSEFCKVQIFKTLGPGDLIVLIDGVSNNDFLKLTEKVLPLPFIKRTFTTILAKKDRKESIKPNKNYQIVSFVRLDLSSKEPVESIVKSIIESDFGENHIDSINLTSGVLDLEIVWRAETSIKTVMEFYNSLMEKSYVRDFQTKFNKNYSLTKDSNCMNIPLDRNGPAR